MEKYSPNPMNLSGIEVPQAIQDALEALAENTHDTWAKKRMSEGWTCGATLDSERKTHPSLVPYRDLPDTEKEYDRATSLQTIKMLLHMGYTIENRGE